MSPTCFGIELSYLFSPCRFSAIYGADNDEEDEDDEEDDGQEEDEPEHAGGDED